MPPPPPIKNNAAEAMAVSVGVAHLLRHKVSKIHVHTDSQYFADLINGGYLKKNNPHLYKYENFEILEFFVDLEEKLKTMGWNSFDLKVLHTPDHSMDFGHLEIDWEVGMDP